MQFITIAGNVGKDAETRSTANGSVTSFSVGVSAGRDGETTWYRCSLWGSRGEKLAGYMRKGSKITVAGTLQAGVYDGKPDLKVNVQEVALQGGGQDRDAAPAPRQHRGGTDPNVRQRYGGGGAMPAGDLDDDVPFATNSMHAREPGASRRVVP